MLHWMFSFAIMVLAPQPSYAADKIKHPSLDPSKVLQITYTNKDWNKDSTKLDSGAVLVKDTATGRMLQIELQEVEPDASRFAGLYALSLTQDQITVEVYILAKDVNKSQIKGSLKELLEKNYVTKRSFAITRDERGLRSLDIYDNPDDAKRAQDLEKDKPPLDASRVNTKAASSSALETGKLSMSAKERKRLEAEARARELERGKMEAVEKQKTEERLQQQKSLSPVEREKRKQQAAAFAEAALDFFRLGQYPKAQENFEKAVELDPENKSYYYQYGVSLYKTDNFNRSLVYLKLADGKDFDPVERDFYIGLNHYKLKEYRPATQVFKKVEATKHATLAPSAAFYLGLVKFAEARYEEAKADFSRVLDISNDPDLDQRAEDYMDKIDRIQFEAKNKARKFLLSANLGPQYDSNVLLAADNNADQGNASNKGSARIGMGAALMYRPLYTKMHELGVKAKTDYIYTTDDTLAKYDTITATGTVPYTLKTTLFDKGFKLDIIPGYERLYLGQELEGADAGKPKETMNSVLFDVLNTVIMNDDWFSSLNFKFRQDKFVDNDSTNANKYNVVTSNSLFLNKAKTQAIVADIGYVLNDANSDDSDYSRIDLTLLYMTPWVWNLQFIGGGAFYSLDYSKKSPTRKDTNATLLASLIKPINDNFRLTLSTTYVTNKSNEPANTYSKYTAGTVLNAEFQF